MRELVTVLAFEDKPIDVEIPKGLVSGYCEQLTTRPLQRLTLFLPEHYHHVALQPRVDAPGGLPSRVDGQRACRVAQQAGCQADPHCRQVLILFQLR